MFVGHKFAKPVSGLIVAIALCTSSTFASAASRPMAVTLSSAASISPFVALSAYGTMQSRRAVCAAAAGSAGAAAATAAAAGEGQIPTQGCVLPVLDQPAPVVVETAPLVAPLAFAPVASGLGVGIGSLLAGLVLVAGLAAVVASSHNNGRLPISPD